MGYGFIVGWLMKDPYKRVKFALRHKVGERIDYTDIWRNRILHKGSS